MPCSDGGYDDREEIIDLHLHCTELTQMLCALCTQIENNRWQFNFNSVPGLAKWWSNHKRQDAERIACEQEEAQWKELRNRALKKLTSQERKMLGL